MLSGVGQRSGDGVERSTGRWFHYRRAHPSAEGWAAGPQRQANVSVRTRPETTQPTCAATGTTFCELTGRRVRPSTPCPGSPLPNPDGAQQAERRARLIATIRTTATNQYPSAPHRRELTSGPRLAAAPAAGPDSGSNRPLHPEARCIAAWPTRPARLRSLKAFSTQSLGS